MPRRQASPTPVLSPDLHEVDATDKDLRVLEMIDSISID